VVGMSFDYVLYNLTGYLCYSTFQCTLYFDDYFRDQYKHEHNTDSVPVETNDVVFALHGLAMVCVIGVQCFLYEKGNQRVSYFCLAVNLLFYAAIMTVGFFTLTPWLKAVYWIETMGYVKAVITVIKYTPQVYLNYKYKSTEGWSIVGVLLDVSGGLLSFLQMGLIAIDDGDTSQFTNFSKMTLAILSLLYDAIFVFQHYILYPHNKILPAEPIITSQKTEIPLEEDKAFLSKKEEHLVNP